MHKSFFFAPVILSAITAVTACQDTPVYNAVPYISSTNSKFGALIEGAGVDRAGNIYAVHYGDKKPAVGKVYREQKELFDDKAETDSWFNAIRFNINPKGVQEVYLGDVVNHRVVRLRESNINGVYTSPETFCQDSGMLQPNDMAIAHSTGRVFLTGMRFTENPAVGDGDLWTCSSSGEAKRLGEFFRTNGIEVSVDEKTLYVSEAVIKEGGVVSSVINAFDLDPVEGTVSNRRTFVEFDKLDGTGTFDIDGMRSDVDGNLYVARFGTGKVAKISPDGKLLAYIQLPSIENVTNLELGGPEGRDLFAVGVCKNDQSKGCIDRLDWMTAKGRAFSKLQKWGRN